jgi:hypothetical protein
MTVAAVAAAAALDADIIADHAARARAGRHPFSVIRRPPP